MISFGSAGTATEWRKGNKMKKNMIYENFKELFVSDMQHVFKDVAEVGLDNDTLYIRLDAGNKIINVGLQQLDLVHEELTEQEDASYEEFLFTFIEHVHKCMNDSAGFKDENLNEIATWAKACDMILVKLKNRKMLYSNEARFHVTGDIYATFCVQVDYDSQEHAAFVRITDEMVEHYGVDIKRVYECAIRNTEKRFPAKLQLVKDFFEENEFENCEAEPVAKDSYIISGYDVHEKMAPTAVAILYQGVLEDIRNEIGNDYYLIPTSVYEWMIVDAEKYNSDGMNVMVNENNKTLPEDLVLSDYCYRYDSETKKIEKVRD